MLQDPSLTHSRGEYFRAQFAAKLPYMSYVIQAKYGESVVPAHSTFIDMSDSDASRTIFISTCMAAADKTIMSNWYELTDADQKAIDSLVNDSFVRMVSCGADPLHSAFTELTRTDAGMVRLREQVISKADCQGDCKPCLRY